MRLLIVDEASRVPDSLMAAVRPMLAIARGRLVALSTPFGARGWWYEAWKNGGATYERVEITALQCPRISAEFLEEEKREIGSFWFDQEYMCKFLSAQSSAFSSADIDRAFSTEVETWAL